jgi:uncharacterized protein YrrD
MIKGTQLVGRAVIDLEAAQRLGKVKQIIVQRDGERVAGFVVVHGETFVGTGGTRRTIPASALHAIGPDAITVRGSAIKNPPHDLEDLPRMSDVIGHKMVTRSGRLLGSIDDMLIDGTDGTIVGFVIGEGVRNKLENIFNPQRSRIHGYVRADADLQVGNELIVVPDDALIEGEASLQEGDHKPAQKPDQTATRGWGDRDSVQSTRSSVWTRRTDRAMRNRSHTPTKTRLTSETARLAETHRPVAPAEETAPETSPPAHDDVPAVPQDQSPQ